MFSAIILGRATALDVIPNPRPRFVLLSGGLFVKSPCAWYDISRRPHAAVLEIHGTVIGARATA